jgi:putative ABC transport system permease protein
VRLPFRARRRGEDDFRAEIDAHVAQETESLLDDGVDPAEARAAALRRFGNVTAARERFYESGRTLWLDDLRMDVAYAFRALARHRAFAIVAVVTLALAIGANASMFGVVNAVLLRPLPFPDADRLVRVYTTMTGPLGRPLRLPLGADGLRRLRAASRTLSEVDAVGTMVELRLGRDELVEMPGARISRTLLSRLGARTILGRLFDERESDDMAPVLILSHRAWRERFGADPQVIGQAVAVEGTFPPPYGPSRQLFTIVGVMAPEFRFPATQTHFWTPLNIAREGGNLNIARLADGVSLETANDEVAAILREPGDRITYEVVRIADEQAAPIRPAMRVLVVAVALVLLVACANVANLLLARVLGRQRELAVRAALGARRGRIVRQLLTESIVLSTLAGIAGVGLAAGGVRVLQSLLSGLVTRMDLQQVGADPARPTVLPLTDVSIDGSTLAFTAVTCLLATLIFGLGPALLPSRRSAVAPLREGSAASTVGFGLFRRNALRSSLVVVQIALATTLLVGGGLFIHSLVRMLTVDKGFQASGALTFALRFPPERHTPLEIRRISDALIARMQGSRGVRAAGYSTALPTVSGITSTPFRLRLDDPVPPPAAANMNTLDSPAVLVVSPGYTRALGMRLVSGRDFIDYRRSGRSRGILINETLARGHFGSTNPVGRVVYLATDPWEIAGVVADVRRDLDRDAGPQVLIELTEQVPVPLVIASRFYYVVRTDGTGGDVLASVRHTLREIDPDTRLDNVASLETLLAASLARPRLYAVLAGTFAAIALLMAAVGIYGVMAHAVAQNTREIGLRLALGAARRTVLTLVLTRAAVMTAAGIAVGVLGALAVTRYLQGMIFGLMPLDAATYTAVVLLFATVSLAAAFVPARRAMHVDPLVALRDE